MPTKPTHLSLLAIDKANRRPITSAPFYAEIVAPLVAPAVDAPPDTRFDEIIDSQLGKIDSRCAGDKACRARTKRTIQEALSRLLTQNTRDLLTANAAITGQLIAEVIRSAQLAGGGSLSALSDDALADAIESALRSAAARYSVAVNAETPTPRYKVAYPLGILATDHVGYLSFDLTRLPAEVYDSLMEAVDARRSDPAAALDVSVWFYAFGLDELRFDALEQGRFSEDAIFTKLEFEALRFPTCCKADGILSMQNPSLTDWRLSPGSFAISPGALVGADGCETLLPANIALHEFHFHQVVGVPMAEVGLPIDPAAAGKVRPGFVNEYRLRFVPIGHSLGQILYTFPLAPGESVNFAVIDWTRRDSALRDENTKLDESLVHELRRDRMITETVRASIDEWQHGGSLMGGMATSAGGAMGGSGMGLAAGASNAIGGAYSTTSGSRDIAADTVQKLSDNVAQAATSSRELYSTIVVQSSQAEHQAIETRTVVNYNHSHALTILYYEVLRHFRVVMEFVRRRPALLTNIHAGITRAVPGPAGMLIEAIHWPTIAENRTILEHALLDERHKVGLDAVETRLHRERTAAAVKALPPTPVAPGPGDRKFGFFTFEVKTGGMFSTDMDDHGHLVEVVADLIGLPSAVSLVDPEGRNVINQKGSFRQGDAVNVFVGVLKPGQPPIEWKSLFAVFVYINPQGGPSQKVSFQHIKVIGTDADGLTEVLIDQPYETGHLIITDEGAHIALPTRRPPAVPASSGPNADLIEQEVRVDAFQDHLLSHRAHYDRALRLASTPAQRAYELASLDVGGGATLLEKVDNRPLEVLGDYVAYSCIDPSWSEKIMGAIATVKSPNVEPVERLITLPTRGVFAEAKLGHCNASEEIDNSRFWDWQTSPIPHLAPDIAPVQPVTPQPVQPGGLQPTPFPASLLNIVNPPNAPDPQGLTAALTALATANIFRDMSGRAELTDLLKRLSDNSVAIAGVAQRAATGGTVLAGQGSSGGGGAADGQTTGGQQGQGSSGGGSSAFPPEQRPPAPQTQQQQQSLQNENNQAQLNMAERLPIPQRRKIEDKVVNDIVGARQWNVSVTSQWLGETITQPVDATFSATVYFDKSTPPGGIYLDAMTTNEVATWTVTHDGRPTHLSVYVFDIKPITFELSLSVPGLTVEGITLKAKTYKVPLQTLGRTLPDTYKATATIDKSKVDVTDPTLKLLGTIIVVKKDIEVSMEFGGVGELGGDLTKAFEANGTIEVLKLVSSATLKAASKATVNGKAGIKATIEVLYIKGYDLKLAP